MHPHIECPKFQPLLKRPFPHSFDGCDSESPRPTKRNQQLPPTFPMPSHSLDRSFRPSPPQDVPLTPPESSQSSKKRKPEDDNPTLNTPNKRRIEDWLQRTRPRKKSCPPRVELKDPHTDKGQYPSTRRHSCPPRPDISDRDAGKGQRPLLEVLQEMSQLQKQSFGAGSVTSGRNTRSVTSHRNYRSTLRNNGIYFDHTGAKIPQELREFLDSSILKQQSDPPTPEAIAEAINTATQIADSPESNVYNLTGTAMLPIPRADTGSGGNTPWYTLFAQVRRVPHSSRTA